jgi:hypothetical protein
MATRETEINGLLSDMDRRILDNQQLDRLFEEMLFQRQQQQQQQEQRHTSASHDDEDHHENDYLNLERHNGRGHRDILSNILTPPSAVTVPAGNHQSTNSQVILPYSKYETCLETNSLWDGKL